MVYANKVKSLILEKESDFDKDNITIKTIKTSGDIFKDKKLSEIGGKKLFCKEIEESLSKKKIDIAVHALKDMESENKNNLNLKSNIYLGKVSRVEPSLQAAFIDFGRERHGFLAFNDIQSDYYQIPTEDKE